MTNNIVKIVLVLVIVALVYFVYESIMKPVRFNKAVESRNSEVVQNLVDIRMAQITYKAIHGKFTGSFDTLIGFLKNGEIPVIKIIPDPTDTTFTRTIRDTLGYIPVIDSLFKGRTGFKVDDIKVIPYTNNEVFKMEAGIIDKGGVKVNVFEASALYLTYLKGLDNQGVINLIATKEQLEKFPGLKVGSMTEATTDGNWE